MNIVKPEHGDLGNQFLDLRRSRRSSSSAHSSTDLTNAAPGLTNSVSFSTVGAPADIPHSATALTAAGLSQSGIQSGMPPPSIYPSAPGIGVTGQQALGFPLRPSSGQTGHRSSLPLAVASLHPRRLPLQTVERVHRLTADAATDSGVYECNGAPKTYQKEPSIGLDWYSELAFSLGASDAL
ncbi:unnamed protein product [Protopolystoma xenopodis]|uniref:Uncharacterized protein n=1 Tax=Protopolystoma xenopodis TaxID=117903 RepID=A0A448WEW1_9PLAT|nr:unnamed protein product [Protopolystoma xenopodis]